jgi:hypothetical protein
MDSEQAGRPSTRQPRGPDGRFLATHGGYAKGADQRRSRRWQFAFALFCGYPSWSSTPAPIKFKIVSAIRLKLLQDRLFSPYWRGEEVPKVFHTVSENLRRVLIDIGDPRPPVEPDVARMLAEMPARVVGLAMDCHGQAAGVPDVGDNDGRLGSHFRLLGGATDRRE